jgi:transcriptional regulator with XRE-family HTH domain
MKITPYLIGKRIKDFREDHEPPMTQKELAEKSGVGLSTIKNIESVNQGRSLSKIDDLLRLADALEVSPYQLLTGIKEENHVACNELGLSSESIDILKEIKSKESEVYALGIQIAINILLKNEKILWEISNYFLDDYRSVFYLDDDGNPMEVETNKIYTLKPDDIERVKRFRIMDLLKETRDKIEEESNEKG